MLDRMATRGIVKRRRSGRHNEIIYVAAIATPEVREAAVKRLVDEQFGGSVSAAAAAVAALARKRNQIPGTSTALKRLVNERALEVVPKPGLLRRP